MNILSLFDGISCGRVALERAGIKIDKYYSSEIDKNAIKVSKKNYPDIIQLGDVKNVESKNLPDIDILMGGSPCQGFSFAGKQLNFDDERSKLFFEFVRLLKEINPKYFLLENVNMKKEYQNIISDYLGVEPIKINSSLISAQNRVRLYWTNIPNIAQPCDRKILLKNIIDYNIKTTDNYYLEKHKDYIKKHGNKLIVEEATKKGFTEIFPDQAVDLSFIKSKTRRGRKMEFKSNCLTYTKFEYCWFDGHDLRLLTPIECERLQTLPDNYTKVEGLSDRKRYSLLGNSWTVDVISHILSFIKED